MIEWASLKPTWMTQPMSFLEHFAELPDPRSHINRTYDLLDIVFLTVCAILSGAEGWKDIEKFGHKKLGDVARSDLTIEVEHHRYTKEFQQLTREFYLNF